MVKEGIINPEQTFKSNLDDLCIEFTQNKMLRTKKQVIQSATLRRNLIKSNNQILAGLQILENSKETGNIFEPTMYRNFFYHTTLVNLAITLESCWGILVSMLKKKYKIENLPIGSGLDILLKDNSKKADYKKLFYIDLRNAIFHRKFNIKEKVVNNKKSKRIEMTFTYYDKKNKPYRLSQKSLAQIIDNAYYMEVKVNQFLIFYANAD